MSAISLPGTLLLLFLAVSCAGHFKSDTQEKQTSSPNIIYVLADDLGYGELGAYGQQKIETPNIDKLARNGMLFTQHYAGSPVCAPSRYMLMTGKHPGHAYIRSNRPRHTPRRTWDFQAIRANPELEGQIAIPDSTITVGEKLQDAGYHTAIIGKWGLGGPRSSGHPNDQGFDFFYGYLGQAMAHTYFPIYLWKNKERMFLDNEPVNPHTQLPDSLDPDDPTNYERFQEQPDYAPTLMLEEALGFIEQNQKNPFFLYYASPLPHVSLQAPRQWVDHYQNKFGEEDPYTGDEGYTPNRYPRATYAAMISYLDEQVGALVKKLKETGQYEQTLIVFTSDNGPTYNGGTDAGFFNSAGKFKESYGWGKGFLHEGGIRVPMIASWPGVILPGSKTDHLSAFWDVFPNINGCCRYGSPQGDRWNKFCPHLKKSTIATADP
ncbi:sulfatase-like hydrolase/transferase [Fodinibius salsisoli]|uniref:Sulfatase-like hydrolase/transferase n=1 Tax=Fodinibius salsisoli TaxID=2820877 RepID=A0ABT3PL16_9BACT|nr:sulfatase-like hydrolase/transferase [Fodinibius salsisoli]MCW9706627.1 sulfatase-like hydrolase/transferase [Fodinibius salsisoli]